MKTTGIISHLKAARGALSLLVHLDLFALAFATTVMKKGFA